MDKILTIVIPTYNMEKYLRKCLDSLIIYDKDLFDKLEVLIVNDGSKDSSSAIAHEYQDNYPNVFRVIDKENGNYGSCVNRGLKEANGKYIKILDADDSFETINFEKFLTVIINVNVDCIISDMKQINENGECKGYKRFNLPINNSFSIDEMGETEWRKMWMHCVCYKTENILKINYHQSEGISYTDQEWICLPMATSKQLLYFPHVVYKYLVGREGQTINTDIWENNFSQEIEGLKVMINEHRSTAIKCDLNVQYVDSRIVARSYTVYFAYFFKFQTYKNHNLMMQFDKYLKENHPLSYDKTQYLILGRFYNCPIVKGWRRNYVESSFTIRFYRYMEKTITVLKKMFKSFLYGSYCSL